MNKALRNFANHSFLFQQLVKRDFEKKYKGTVLGMFWSILSPLLLLLVLKLVFTEFFGRNQEHYTIYLSCGTLVMNYFREGTKTGMSALIHNAGILGKINVPKYLFIFSRNVSALVNFAISLVVFFVFCILDHITFTPKMFLLIFPIGCLLVLNLGIGMVLSAMYVMFRDTNYLYDVFLRLLTYVSAIFYSIDRFPAEVQQLFLLNPVYVYINYFRTIVIGMEIPSLAYHAWCLFYPAVFFLLGCVIYKKNNHKFIYYL